LIEAIIGVKRRYFSPFWQELSNYYYLAPIPLGKHPKVLSIIQNV
jgi:hypothetical protein